MLPMLLVLLVLLVNSDTSKRLNDIFHSLSHSFSSASFRRNNTSHQIQREFEIFVDYYIVIAFESMNLNFTRPSEPLLNGFFVVELTSFQAFVESFEGGRHDED